MCRRSEKENAITILVFSMALLPDLCSSGVLMPHVLVKIRYELVALHTPDHAPHVHGPHMSGDAGRSKELFTDGTGSQLHSMNLGHVVVQSSNCFTTYGAFRFKNSAHEIAIILPAVSYLIAIILFVA